MYGVFLAVHLLVCIALVAVILVQSGKGGGLAGGAFGGATQTVFGGRGATDFITRATIWLGVAFFLTSFTLALLTSHGGLGGSHKSLLQTQARKAAQTAPQQLPRQGGAPAGGVPVGGTAPSGAR